MEMRPFPSSARRNNAAMKGCSVVLLGLRRKGKGGSLDYTTCSRGRMQFLSVPVPLLRWDPTQQFNGTWRCGSAELHTSRFFSSTRKRDQMLKANAACNASSKSGPITPLRREGLSAHHKYKPEQCNDQEAPFQVLSLSDCL